MITVATIPAATALPTMNRSANVLLKKRVRFLHNNSPSQRFDVELAKALDACNVFVAVIGPRWIDLLRQCHLERRFWGTILNLAAATLAGSSAGRAADS